MGAERDYRLAREFVAIEEGEEGHGHGGLPYGVSGKDDVVFIHVFRKNRGQFRPGAAFVFLNRYLYGLVMDCRIFQRVPVTPLFRLP